MFEEQILNFFFATPVDELDELMGQRDFLGNQLEIVRPLKSRVKKKLSQTISSALHEGRSF